MKRGTKIMGSLMSSLKTGQVAGRRPEQWVWEQRQRGPVCGEMGVDPSARGHNSRLQWGLQTGTKGHCAVIFHLFSGLDPPGLTLLCPVRLTTWTAKVGTLALCLGVGDHGEARQEMQGGRKVGLYDLLPWLPSWVVAVSWLHPSTSW